MISMNEIMAEHRNTFDSSVSYLPSVEVKKVKWYGILDKLENIVDVARESD